MTDKETYDNLSKEEKSAIDFFDLGFELEDEGDAWFNKNIGIIGLLFNNKLNFDFKGIRRFFFIGLGVITLNGILITILLLKYFFADEVSFSGNILLLFLGLGFLAGGYAIYRAYQYAILDAFYIFYDKFITKGIRKLSGDLVDKAAEILIKNPKANQQEFHSLLNLGGKIESYLSIFPNFVKKVFLRIFEQIPIVGYLMKFRTFIMGDMRQNAIDKVYTSIDGYFRGAIESALTLKWLFWLIPLNILIYLLLIF